MAHQAQGHSSCPNHRCRALAGPPARTVPMDAHHSPALEWARVAQQKHGYVRGVGASQLGGAGGAVKHVIINSRASGTSHRWQIGGAVRQAQRSRCVAEAAAVDAGRQAAHRVQARQRRPPRWRQQLAAQPRHHRHCLGQRQRRRLAAHAGRQPGARRVEHLPRRGLWKREGGRNSAWCKAWAEVCCAANGARMPSSTSTKPSPAVRPVPTCSAAANSAPAATASASAASAATTSASTTNASPPSMTARLSGTRGASPARSSAGSGSRKAAQLRGPDASRTAAVNASAVRCMSAASWLGASASCSATPASAPSAADRSRPSRRAAPCCARCSE